MEFPGLNVTVKRMKDDIIYKEEKAEESRVFIPFIPKLSLMNK